MAEREPYVTRRVHFFKIAHASEILHLLPDCLQAIDALPWEQQGRYQQDISDNTYLSVMPHGFTFPLRLEFGRTRRDNLPAIERKGVKETLEIAEDAGLIDVSHIVIFEDGFVAAEFNRDGPRIKKLGEYLFFKGKNLPEAPRFQRLFERDVIGLIDELENVKFLELEVPPDATALLREADDNLYDALEASRKVNQSELIGIHFQAKSPGDGVLKKLARKLAAIAIRDEDSREKFNTLRVKGYDNTAGKVRPIDILEDYLIVATDFPRASPKSRSVATDAAFKAIEQAYRNNRAKLPGAVSGREIW